MRLRGSQNVRYLTLLFLSAATIPFVLFSLLTAASFTLKRSLSIIDLAALPLKNDQAWYRDVGGKIIPEIQDLDLFYHNLGPSITAEKKADIVILGPSFVLYAFDRDILSSFSAKYALKTYNMGFLGVRSGEFSHEIIKRWNIQPKLWVINVDDQFDPFFSPSLNMWWFKGSAVESMAIPPPLYNRSHAWLNVMARNMKWRAEDIMIPSYDASFYRNINDGSVHFENNPKYTASDNEVISLGRNQDCHAPPQAIDVGRKFLSDIGGRAVLTLVPNSQYCPQQARELAQALGIEAIFPPTWKYTTVDGGGHLDHLGAAAFTADILAELVRTSAFRDSFMQ